MLDGAQEPVTLVQVGPSLGADPATVDQRRERRQSLTTTQFGMPAASDQLLRLHEKLDLADAAAAKLDVMSLDRNGVVTTIGVDLALQRLDVGQRDIVQVFP